MPMPKKIEKYLENVRGLAPLDLPDEDVLSEEISSIDDLAEMIEIQVNLPNSRFGPGKVLVALDGKKKRVAYMAVSPNMMLKGMKKTQILDDGLHMYSDCWNKPTTAGVAGCVVDTFCKWLMPA